MAVNQEQQPGMSLLNLENKTRQQPKIAHEQGAGSQCNRCGPKCSGFDLHYWRKICRNCRCGKENHSVKDEEDPANRVGRLLNGPSNQTTRSNGTGSSRPSQLKLSLGIAKDGGPASPLDWAPPAADAQLAVKYIEQLPVEQQPITGSQAAADRKRALNRQLPSHDLDPERCQSLSVNEKRMMEEYVNNVKQFAIGQGLIQECPGKLPPPPPQLHRILEEKVNHLSIQSNKPDAVTSKQQQQQPVRPLPQFITAKPFVVKPPAAPEYVDPDFSDLPPPPPDMLVNLPTPPPPPPPPAVEEQTACETKKTADPVREFFDFLDEQEGKKLPGKLKSPFLHQAAAAGTFNATAKPFGRSPSSSPNMNSSRPSTLAPGKPSSRGSPPGGQPEGTFQSRRVLTTDLDALEPPARPAGQQNQTTINNNNSTNGLPANPSLVNNNARAQQPTTGGTIQQPHQQEVIQEPEKEWTCRKCIQPIVAGTVAIFAERAGSDKCWHPQCFTCSICNEMLADLIYFYVDDNVFCGRHYAEKMQIPRCKACDELIFAPEYTSADNASWHTNHFCCWICDTPLAGKQYTPIEGQPHCLDCYQKKYGKDCYECGKSIRADESRVSHGEMHWHNAAACFKCRSCKASMMNRQFILKNGHIFCSRDCVRGSPQQTATSST